MSTDIQNMIDSLAAAKVAMEENPQLKSEVVSLSKEVIALRNDQDELEHKHRMIKGDHSIACNRILELEAALEQARFREQSTRQTLEKLVSGVSEAISEVAPATVDSTEPNPDMVEQHAEVLAQEVDEVERNIGQTIERLQVEDFSPSSDPTSDTEFGQGPQSNAVSFRQYNAGDPTALERLRETPELEESTALVNERVIEAYKPYSGRHYSMKPNDMPWPTWVEFGGDRPWWLTDAELDKLREGSALAS